MLDNEMLQAFSQIIDAKLAPIQQDMKTMSEKFSMELLGIKVILENDIEREIKLLAEGHETILRQQPDPEEIESIEARLSAVEVVVRKLGKDIQNLKKAQ